MEADSHKSPFPEALAALGKDLGQVLPKVLDGYLRPTTPDAVALGVIVGAGDENLRASAFSPLISSDARYRNYLFAQTFLSERMSVWFEENQTSADREQIALDRTLGLLGKTPIRNLMACAHVEKILGTLDLSETADLEKKINPRPTELIPFALEAEKTCQDRSWIFPDTAFSAGLHYDWLSAIVKKRGGTPDDKAAIANAFAEGMLTAKMAYAVGERTKEIKGGKFLFSAGLALPIGKALMGCLYPKGSGKAWTDFTVEADKMAERKFDFYQFIEKRRFPITHPELSSLFVNFGAVLRDVEKVLYYYQDPEAIRKSEPELYALSVAVSLASRMATTGGAPFPIEGFQAAWMKANRLKEDSLSIAAAETLKSK